MKLFEFIGVPVPVQPEKFCIFCGSSTLSSDACESCITEKIGNGHQHHLQSDDYLSNCLGV
jgi:hypothetical protein